MIDLRRAVKDSKDLHFLETLLTTLVGQVCLKLEMSYGEELTVHLGEPAPYVTPKLADEQRGSWILGTRASAWSLTLNSPPTLIASDAPASNGVSGERVSSEDIERKAACLAGTTIVAAAPVLHPLRKLPFAGVALVVEFSDRSRLVVLPSDDPDGEPALADWELFTPFHTYLTCGPGPLWSYLRSDEVTALAST